MKPKSKGKKECKHTARYLNLMQITKEYPEGLNGTSAAVQYAYFLCMKCSDVIKKEIINA